MSNIPLAGSKAYANSSVRGTLLTSGDTIANTWYEIKALAAVTALPIDVVSAVFRSPDGVTQITLAVGDEIYPITLTNVCKTDADVTFEEGSIDVTDDCENGFDAMILDGFKKISGTLNGFSKFDDDSGTLSTGTEEVFGRFINIVTDDSAGVYVETKVTNEKLLLFVLMNRDAEVGDIQNWLIIPIIITGLGTGAGLKDAQKRDITWTKAPGYPSLYKRTVVSADVIS